MPSQVRASGVGQEDAFFEGLQFHKMCQEVLPNIALDNDIGYIFSTEGISNLIWASDKIRYDQSSIEWVVGLLAPQNR